MITTTDEKGEKGLCGGMMPRQCKEQPIVNYVGVPSVDEHAAKIEQLGGKIIMPKTAVPGIGYFAVAMDTENNAFAIWEDDKAAA